MISFTILVAIFDWLSKKNKINILNEWVGLKDEDSKMFSSKSYFKSKNNIVSINLNQSNNCCLYSLRSKDLSI